MRAMVNKTSLVTIEPREGGRYLVQAVANREEEFKTLDWYFADSKEDAQLAARSFTEGLPHVRIYLVQEISRDNIADQLGG